MKDRDVVAQAMTALKPQGLDARILKWKPLGGAPNRPDALVRIVHGGETVELLAVIFHRLTGNTVGAALARLPEIIVGTNQPTLLVTDYIAPPVAEKLRAHGQAFADTVGNAYLEAPGLLVFITGHKKPETRFAANTAFTVGGLKVLFALICERELADAPQRKIAEAAGVALGTVPTVLRDLKRTGRLLVAGRHRRLNGSKRLLDEWALAYAQRLRDKTFLAAYETANFANWKDWPLHDRGVRWGCEPAANLLVDYLVPGTLTLYADKLPPRLKVEQHLVRTEATANARVLVLRKPFWGTVVGGDTRPQTVPPALVYADLLANGDARCLETAGMVHDRYLARLFPAG